MDEDNKKDSGMVTFSTKKTRPIPQISRFDRQTLSARAGSLKSNLSPSRLILLLACLMLGFGGGWLGALVNERDGSSRTTKAAKQQIISDESQLISQIAKDVGQSVVSIDVQSQVAQQDIFGFSAGNRTQESAGTGFIISSDGIIITNRHVVPNGSDTVDVTTADGTIFKNVKVIGRASSSSALDVAFLKITDLNGKKLTPVTLGDSSKVRVGDKVIAIGNALGQFQNTVTSGIISGYGRDVTAGDSSSLATESLTDLFQTDAAINAGNSGGPLVNINGQVIGINTAVAGNAQNIGFSIPANDLKGLIGGVLDTGELKQSYLGVRYISLTDDLASQYGLKLKRGAYIVPSSGGQAPSVVPDSPADKAGLKEKDIITKVNNITIDDKTSLVSALSRFKVGETVSLTVVRGDKTLTIKAVLGATPAN